MINLKHTVQRTGKRCFLLYGGPLIVAGHRTASCDAITLLGGINIAGGAVGRYPKYSIEEIFPSVTGHYFRRKGDVGKGPEDMRKLAGSLLDRIAAVPAVKNNRVFL